MIRLYDTGQRALVELQPMQPGRLGIYVCGPTVYDFSHVGHARVYVAFDVIVRYLRARKLQVTYVRNITDVDDNIIKRAAEAGQSPTELARRFADEYHHDMRLLGCVAPDVEPRVSEHIPEIVALIERLVAQGCAYAVDDGDVYFAVEAFAPYGALSGRNLDELRAGARVEVNARKRNPLDFALWKAAKPGEPSWDSPWGAGRPGWHIECSAMGAKYLGAAFDVHGGGPDLIFPHHENEVAQSRAADGPQAFARHWMHCGFLTVRTAQDVEEKMSKSLGNFFTIREVCARHEPEALRLYLLSTQYRSPISFEIDRRGDDTVVFPGIEEAERRLAYGYRTLLRLQQALGDAPASEPASGPVLDEVDTLSRRFLEALDEDFNTAAALGFLAELMTLGNRLLDQNAGLAKDLRRRTLRRIRDELLQAGAIFGIFGRDPAAFAQTRRELLCKLRGIDAAHVEALITRRAEARKAKDFAAADAIRAELAQLGVELMDSALGSSWSLRETS